MKKLFAAFLAFFFSTFSHATGYWTPAAATVDVVRLNAAPNSGTGYLSWFVVHGVASLGTCGTVTTNGSTYVLFEFEDASIGTASSVQNALMYADSIDRSFSAIWTAYITGTTVLVYIDDSLKDGNGYCYVQSVRAPS